MKATVNIEVSYSQLAVFSATLKQPFNDWSDQHVAQGFSWRPGSVSFRSAAESGPHSVEIIVVDNAGAIENDALRVIEVPFEIPSDGEIEIGSISCTAVMSFPEGKFLLRCEFLSQPNTAGQRVRLTFARKDTPRFAIVRADEQLSPPGELVTTAQPASI